MLSGVVVEKPFWSVLKLGAGLRPMTSSSPYISFKRKRDVLRFRRIMAKYTPKLS
jgi:hypothetical protein